MLVLHSKIVPDKRPVAVRHDGNRQPHTRNHQANRENHDLHARQHKCRRAILETSNLVFDRQLGPVEIRQDDFLAEDTSHKSRFVGGDVGGHGGALRVDAGEGDDGEEEVLKLGPVFDC